MSINYPSNTDDVIDSRDVIETIESLQAILADPDQADTNNGMIGDDEIDAGYLDALVKLAEQGEDLPDWQHGETLVRDTYFTEYAQELADECGMVPTGLSWPMTCIDWSQAARELQYDYTAIDFDGVTYWGRG